MVKVNQSDGAKIPHAVVVSAGLPPKAKSWTCPVFVLKHKSVTMLGDEDRVPHSGPLFPMSVQPPRWLGFSSMPPSAGVQDAGDHSSVGLNPDAEANGLMNVDGLDSNGVGVGMAGVDLNLSAAMDAQSANNAVNVVSDPGLDNQMSPAAADFAASDHSPSPLAMVVAARQTSPQALVSFLPWLIDYVPSCMLSHICSSLTSFSMDLDTLVPSYISDERSLFFLASICFEQAASPVVIGPAASLVPYSDDEDEDVIIINKTNALPTPRKRRSHRLKEPLDERFLRRSKRQNPSLQGFKNAATRDEASSFPAIYTGKANMGPSDAPAPFLTHVVLHGLGSGFLQIQPSTVSVAILEDLDDVNLNPNV